MEADGPAAAAAAVAVASGRADPAPAEVEEDVLLRVCASLFEVEGGLQAALDESEGIDPPPLPGETYGERRRDGDRPPRLPSISPRKRAPPPPPPLVFPLPLPLGL